MVDTLIETSATLSQRVAGRRAGVMDNPVLDKE